MIILARAILLFLVYFIRTPIFFWEFLQIKLFKRHLLFRLVAQAEIGSKVFVNAIYPGTSTIESTLRLIKMAKENQYSVICVLNENQYAEKWSETIQAAERCTIIIRKNIGRDLGAYQSAINFLKSESYLDQISTIALFNDTLVITPNATNIIGNLLEPSSEQNCLYIHNQTLPHAASHSLKFDFRITNKRDFVDFWRKYYPHSFRRLVVLKGELKITRFFGLEYFKPIVDADLLVGPKFQNLSKLEYLQSLNWSKVSDFRIFNMIRNLNPVHESDLIILLCFDNLQISNSLGLYLNRVHGIPLKMDLVKYKHCTKSVFLQKLEEDGINPDEIRQLKSIFDKDNAAATSSLSRRILLRAGVNL